MNARINVNKKFRMLWQLLPALISAGILWYAFRGIPREAWIAALDSITVKLVAGFILFSLIGTFLRLWRFSILLSHRISVFDLFLITLVQNFSLDLLPARTAALAFFTYFTRRAGIDTEDGISSFVSTIVYDVLAVALLLSPVVLFWKGGLSHPLPVLTGLLLLMALSLIFLRAAPVILQWLSGFRFLQREWLNGILSRTTAYFRLHHTIPEQAKLLGISFLIKAAKYIAIFVLFTGLTGAEVTFRSFFLFNFAVAAAEVSAYLPVQGLGGFGTWEAAFTIALKWTGIHLPDPFLTAFVIHVISQDCKVC